MGTLRDLHPVSDGEPHYLTFTRNQNEPVWHSEAVRLQGKFSAEDHYETISETLLIDEDFFRVFVTSLSTHLMRPKTRDPKKSTQLAMMIY